MKKLFTLAALLLAASAVNAQYVTKALDENDESTFNWENASNFILFSVGEAEREAMEGKILADYGVNDVDVHMWVWENTYTGGDGSGMNSFGQLEDHIALTVANVGWSGFGMIKDGGIDLSMLDDTYVLHFAMKAKPTDMTSHGFGFAQAKFTIGPTAFVDGARVHKLLGDIGHDNEWYYIDIPFSVLRQCADNGDVFPESKGGAAAYNDNHFWCLSGGVPGSELHIDNIFIYKDATIPEPVAPDYVLHYGTEGAEWQDVTFVESDGKFIAENVEFAAGTEFKVNYGDVWYGGVTPDSYYLLHSEWCENIPLDATGKNFRINEAGTYTFVLDVTEEGIKMNVTGWPEPQEPEYVLHYGLNEEGAEWQDVVFSPSEAEGEWVATADFVANTEFKINYGELWYGGVTEDPNESYYLLHSEWCENIPLDTSGKNFHINEAGNFHFVLNVGEITTLTVLGIPAPALPGDYNGDGIVDITDVNAVINMMLGKEPYMAICDFDGSGNIDISDVNAVINKMLGK